MKRIKVNLNVRPSASYDIHIGCGILDRLALIVARSGWAKRFIVVSDENVAAVHGSRFLSALGGAGVEAPLVIIPVGEGAKTMDTCLHLTERLAAVGADRSSALIALGGGVVGDLTGFTAAIYMRGIPYIQVPTTLMAQVDSAIGGKTGVDDRGAKNVLGAFHQPKAVMIDLEFLHTLPDKEMANGIAEIAKYGAIEDPGLLDLLEKGEEALRLRNKVFLEEIVSRSCRIKKAIVEIDEMEKGVRRILNFGHTVGHALEAASGFSLPHGEAVAVGMCAAARLSERLHHLSREEVQRLVKAVCNAGLPTRMPEGIDMAVVMERMKRDKKKDGERINFVLLKRLGLPFLNGGVSPELVGDVLEEMRL